MKHSVFLVMVFLVLAGCRTAEQDMYGKEVAEREYICASRGKMDWTFDAMRAIRSKEYKLIVNLMPERAWCQYNNYKERQYPVLALLNMMNLKGELTPEQAKFMAPGKPGIELYDVIKDPWELNNLAEDPDYAGIKEELLSRLTEWRESIDDPGVSEEFRQGGWPPTYPTRSLEEWSEIVEEWDNWLFSKPYGGAEYPQIGYIPGASPVIVKK